MSSYCNFSLWSHLPSVVGDRSFGVFDFDESVPSPSFLSLSALSPSLDSTWIVDIKEWLRLWHFTFAFSQVFVFLLLWGGVRVGQTEKPNIQSWKWGKSWTRIKNISEKCLLWGRCGGNHIVNEEGSRTVAAAARPGFCLFVNCATWFEVSRSVRNTIRDGGSSALRIAYTASEQKGHYAHAYCI